ncbi:hypothetical protein Droror1_Dr00000166 [Drosera rotundifolia]
MERRKERRLAAMAGSVLCSRPAKLVILAHRLWQPGCFGICHGLRKTRRLVDLDETRLLRGFMMRWLCGFVVGFSQMY